MHKETLLSLEKVCGGYVERPVLHNISLTVTKGQVVSLLGANGAGKTTTLKAISGYLPEISGHFVFKGQNISTARSHQRAKMGIAHIPEGRRVFATLSVLDNLHIGSHRLKEIDRAIEAEVFQLFPRLRERAQQIAGTLSGGEQQMLAIGRGLMSKPDLLILDEPSMGLAPKIVDEVFQALQQLKKNGLTMLIVEQYAQRALEISDYGYVMNQGEIVLHNTAQELLTNHESLHSCYLS